jgi:hypothetical protein
MRSCARLSEPMRVGSQSAPCIAIIAVHFGVLPNYFQLWLDSCGHNEKFNWLVFADADLSTYAAPGNVGFRPMTLSGFRERMSDALGFEIGLGSPYKVCDFRPAFSVLLEGEACRYDYWGHCDIDMIFGDLSRFVTADLLARYDKTFSVGHLTLYRNCALANEMFRRPHRAIDWRVVLGDPRHRGFDEHIGVNRIWRESGERMYEDESHIADIDPAIARFELAAPRKNYRRQLFYFDRGHLLRGYAEGARWSAEEFAYIHFQKRTMKAMPSPGADRYAIAPGGFFDLAEGAPSAAQAEALNPAVFHWSETSHRLRRRVRDFRRRYGLGPLPPPLR